MKKFLAITALIAAFLGVVSEVEAGAVIQHLLHWNSNAGGAQSSRSASRQPEGDSTRLKLEEKMLLGAPAIDDPVAELPVSVLNRSETWVVSGRCLGRREAVKYFTAGEGNLSLLGEYLASSGVSMDERVVLRAAFRSSRTCWYIDARLTLKTNIRN
jgi:hypothetical protein